MLPWAILAFIIKPLPLKGFSDGVSEKVLTSGDILSHDVEGKQVLRGKADTLARIEDNDQITTLTKDEVKPLNHFSRLLRDIKELLDKVFIVNVLGYISYNFVIGAYSYWGPKAGYGIYQMKNADMMFGGITIICGILGTLAGGVILDRVNSTINNAFKLLSGATFLGAIFCFSAFCMKNMYGFLALFAVGELLVFATQ
ncbi:Major facilitator superfamily, partial [Thalictrum thalictroides]